MATDKKEASSSGKEALLDEVLYKYLEAVEGYFRLKCELEDVMREGYLGISKARYSMGVKFVSDLQYDSEMTALATVEENVSPDQGHGYKTIRQQPDSQTVTGKSAMVDSSSLDEKMSGVRQRHTAKVGQALEEKDVAKNVEVIGERIHKRPVLQDPLRWFGVLVPSALRSAQTSFINAVDRCLELATLHSQCEKLRQRYVHLLAEKN